MEEHEREQAMVVSEEELRVRAERRPVERVRVHRRIVTEEVTITVPVSHEELTIERLPVDGEALGSPAGPAGAADVDEVVVVLRAERPIVSKEVVPVEEVRVVRERHTEERVVVDEIRRERVELEIERIPRDAPLPPEPR